MATAVATEPTPTPTAGEYLAAVRPLAKFAAEMADRFGTFWSVATDPREQAALLDGHGRRMATLCRGVGLAPSPADTASLAALIRDAVRGRHKWVSAAAAGLTCCGAARTPELEALELETRDALVRALGELPPADAAAATEASTRSADDLGVTFSVPAGWVVVRSDFEVVLLAPARLQRVGKDGLGTGPRPNGSAVRMWTVNRPGQYTLEDALRDSQPVLARYGELTGVEDIVVDAVEGVWHATENAEAEWRTQLAVFALEGRGYFFEAACPVEVVADCQNEAERILRTLQFGPST